MKQWKRLAALSSAIVMAMATLTYFPNDTLQNIRLEISASADETSAGTTTEPQVWIEDNLTWTLDADGTLTISGTGAMKDYSSSEGNRSPAHNNSNVKKVVIEDGVTSIGYGAFSDCTSLQTISLSCKSSLKKSNFGDQADLVSASHTLKKTEAKAKTCTEDGNKEYCTCEHCGKYFLSDDTNPETAKAVEQSETIIPASHKLTKVKEEKAPTCTEDGNKEYWTCEHCKKYFLSDDTNPETAKAVELSETITPALKHKNATTRGAAEPTETAPGYSGDRYCPDCDTVFEKGYTYWNEGNLTWKLDADGTLTISGTGAMKDYDADDNRSPAYNNLKVKKIVIEDGVTSIGESAFENCSLTSITIPKSVTSIGELVFYGCNSLTSITIPDGVTSIGNFAFAFCRNLTGITISDSVTSIGDDAFYNCSSLISITIPKNVTSIGNSVFENCSSLTDITIPDRVTSIGNWAFLNCSSLTSITIPDRVTSIGNTAFYNCSGLTSITIPDSVTSIGNTAFYNCSGLTSITIPDSVTSIGDSVFSNCESLTTISLSCGSALKKSNFGEQADLVSYTNQHLLTKTEAKTATCTEDGNKAYWTCEHCGKYFLSDDSNPETAKAVELSETVISASHKLTKVEAKDATCAKDGNKEYWTCEHCKKYFLSDDTNPETAKAVEQSETVIPALKHKNETIRGASKPDGTKPGYSGDRYCPDCDTVLEKGYTYWNEGNLTWKLDAKGTLTISGTGAMKDYDSDSNPSPVSNNWDVEKIVIEDGVTSIGDCAFYDCHYLTSITIPNSVTSIGIRAFNVCRNLTNITIPDNVTSIGNYAFYYCENLTSVTISNSVTSIGDFAFYNCRSLTSITIPDRVTSIGNFVFDGCKGLTSITIPDSITSIGDFAFRYCISLTSITIPDRVTSIGNAAFDGCKGLTSITIPDSVTSIGNSAFRGCSSLTSITIPKNVTSIRNSVFDGCKGLTSITIPDSVTSIGGSAFYNCSGLTSITIPDSVTSIEKYTFKNCSSLTSITIPDSVTSIRDFAFSDCTSLKTISLSCKSSLKKSDFGEQADLVSYTNQHLLTKTEAKDATCTEDGNKEYWTCEHCGKYFLSDDTNPETAKAVEQAETVIPASHKLTKVEAKDATCTENGNKAYWTCEHCKKYFLSDDTNPETAKAVEQSETVIPALKHKNATTRGASEPTETEPGYSGDRYCPDCDTVLEKGYTYWNEDNLTWKLDVDGTLTISGTGTMKDYNDIDNLSPAYCNSKVKKVVIEDGVTSIGDSAFESCNTLISITIPDGVTSIGESAFCNCTSLTSITIPDGVTSIEEHAFYGCNSLTSITIPGNVTSIENGMFYNCSSLTDIVIPNSVTSIGYAAFYGCNSLTSITIPGSVTSIESSTFYGCNSLTSITIPDSVTSIGYAAFNSCGSLTSITIPDSVTSIGRYAFQNCSSLKSITIPDSVTSIGDSAFYSCEKLTSITIPDSVTSIGDAVFKNCSSLKAISLSCKSTLKRSDFGDQADLVSYTSHTLKKTEAKDATCAEDGNKEYWTCEHCGKYFLSDDANPETAKAVELSETVIPASHKLTKVEAKDATCTEDGNKAYWTCEHCKKYFLSDDSNPETAKVVELSETVIPASHKLTKVEAKAATCTENGNKEYWTCEHCGKYFLSDDSNPETAKAVELSETVIPALVQVATTITPIKCVYGQDMSKIDLRDYVKNTDVVGEVTVKVATDSTLPDGIKLDGSKLSGKPAKAYEDSKEVTFTFTAENGSTANLTLLFLVAKADPTVEVSVSGDSHTEGDLVSELKLILSENSTKGVVEIVSEIKALAAGKNTFTWKFTPEDENNYNMVTGTVAVNAKTTTTTTKATTTTTKATTTTTTKATTTTKPNKTTTTNATTTNTAIPSYGDVNLDGKVDILDAVYLNRYLATLIQFSDVQIANADCYQDGVLDDQDTTALMQFIILLIDDLPVQPTEK